MYRPFKKIRLRFVELDMNQREAARRSGIPEGTMTDRMTAKHPWHADEILALCKVLNIPHDQIGAFFFEDTPTEKKGASI